MSGTVQELASSALFKIINDLGYNPEPIFAAAGVPSNLRAKSGCPGSPAIFARLLEQAACITGCAHIGLLAGAEVKLSWMGRAGYIALNSANVGDAWESITAYVNRNHRAASVTLKREDVQAAVIYQPLAGDEATDQFIIFAASCGVTLMREICGANWAPDKVTLGAKSPHSATLYMNYFRSEIRFSAPETMLAFNAATLSQSIPHAQPDIRLLLQKDIGYSDRIYKTDLLLDVTRIVRALVGSGECSTEKICLLLGLRPRSLTNRLAAKGKTLKQIIEDVRFQIAKQLISTTALSLADISAKLDYSEVSAFNRAFNRWAGMPPGDWRRRLPADSE